MGIGDSKNRFSAARLLQGLLCPKLIFNHLINNLIVEGEGIFHIDDRIAVKAAQLTFLNRQRSILFQLLQHLIHQILVKGFLSLPCNLYVDGNRLFCPNGIPCI